MERRRNYGLFGGAKSVELGRRIEELTEDRDTISQIMETMQEGLVLISLTKKVLSANHNAVLFLTGKDDKDYTGQPLPALTRSVQVLDAVGNALAGEGGALTLEMPERVCRIYVNPARGGSGIMGVILMIVDISRDYQILQNMKEFPANSAREIKAPLSSIVAWAEALPTAGADIPALAEQISGEAKRLIGMAESLLRLAQIPESTQDNRRVKVNMKTLAQRIAVELAAADERKIDFAVEGGNVMVLGNLNLLHEMLYHVMENAVRYNCPGGSVCTEISEVDGRAVIIVADSGPGISAEQLPHLFDRFYRGEKTRRSDGGAGLGLALVKQIVEYHRGEVTIQSEAGKGTGVTITLPLE